MKTTKLTNKKNLHKLTLWLQMINTTYLWFCGDDSLDFHQNELEMIGGIGDNLRGCVTDVVFFCSFCISAGHIGN